RTARPYERGAAGTVLARAVRPVGADRWETVAVELDIVGTLSQHDPVDVALRWHPGETEGDLVLDRVSVLPHDHVDGLDPDILALATGVVPELRWPGGNAASHYRWREGVGPADLRPTVPNHAWGGLEHHLIGTDEYIA